MLILVSHALCPFVQRVAIALLEKGVPFKREDIDLSDRPDWFVQISPLGKVPLLRVKQGHADDAILFESSVICEYIEETQQGLSLHPSDPLQRARHRAWMEFATSAIADLWQMQTTKGAEPFEAAVKALARKFAFLEKALADGPWFAGDVFGLVDAAFAPIFRYFALLDPLLGPGFWTPLPRSYRWRVELAKRPSVINAVHPDYLHNLRRFLQSYDSYVLRGAQ